jgi:hypothetical protein
MFRVSLIPGFSFLHQALPSRVAVLPFAEFFRHVTPSKGEDFLHPKSPVTETIQVKGIKRSRFDEKRYEL